MAQINRQVHPGTRYALALFVALAFGRAGGAADDDYPHLLLGNPSKATADKEKKGNYLLKKKFFALSYNDGNGTPNWVSWRVTKDDIGTAPRKRTFDADDELPEGFNKVVHKDYNSTGFDRGHMCPHSDRAKDKKMSFATFVMTNVIPQAPNVNQKAWNQMEIYCRDLVKNEDRRLYVIAGPAGRGGRGRLGFKTDVADEKVKVPSMCWKIVVVVENEGEDDLKKVTKDTRVIAVIMPNDNDVGFDWGRYRTSVREIEKKTKLTFFDKLPADVAKALKEGADSEPLPPPVPRTFGPSNE